MNEPAMALMTVDCGEGQPTLQDAALRLGVSVGDLDTEYGMVRLDPAKALYAVRVRADRLAQESRPGIEGPFADPPIEPF